MTKGDFENDHLGRKATRSLLIIEFAALLVALILIGLRAALVAFLLAILTLIMFVGVLAWLYFRFRAFPIVQEKAALQRKAEGLQARIRLEGNKINEANQKRAQLSQSEQQEMSQALENLQRAYIQNGLANTPLGSAEIPGVGPKLKERLASHRILTAADINSSIGSIQGFGGATSQALLSWRQSIYEELNRRKPSALAVETSNAIRQKYQELNEGNNAAEEAASLRSIQPRLQELVPLNFIAYLSRVAAPQKGISILILSLLVVVQCVLGSSTSMASIAASLPTFTFTPTQTSTPTLTYTPTITNTETFTLTPTITFTPTLIFTPTVTFTPQATLPPTVTDCVPKDTPRETALVIGIVDGDTIDVRLNDQVFRVRYIGIDTPERDEAFYNQAAAYNQQLVFNKTVTMLKDISETDRFDRLLRYIIVGDTFVNHELVNAGYAAASVYPPDTACASLLASAQRQAQAAELGMWMPVAVPATPQVPVSGGNSGNCHPSYPTVCIPPPPPDLDCSDISYKRFQVLPPDPHNFDRDGDGIGCES